MVEGGARMQHHEIWRAHRRLQTTDFGGDVRDSLARILKLLLAYDQCDITNLAAAEQLVRKLQLIEHFYDERDIDNVNQNAKLPLDEVRAFIGGAAR